MDTVSSNAVQHRIIYHIIIGQIQLSLQKPNIIKLMAFKIIIALSLDQSLNQSVNQSINQPMKKNRPQLLKEWIALSLDQSLNQSVNQSSHQVSKSANHSWSIED